MRAYRRKRTREGRLLLLGKVLSTLDQGEVRSVWDVDGRRRASADSVRLLRFVGRGRRLVERLADHAAKFPYLATAEVSPSPAKHVPLDGTEQRREHPSLAAAVAEVLEVCRPWERKVLQMKFGVDGQRRLPEKEIARRLGVSIDTVERRVKAALAIVSALTQ